jgi:hypothetical protein
MPIVSPRTGLDIIGREEHRARVRQESIALLEAHLPDVVMA